MKININNIPDEGLHLRFGDRSGWRLGDHLPDGTEETARFRDLDVRCLVRKVREVVFISGKLGSVLTMTCDRCLEEGEMFVEAEFSYTLRPLTGLPGEAETELTAEDLDEGYYEGDLIDLTPLVREQLLLQIPMKFLCRPECRGLCPRCGANLNTAPCSCGEGKIDERLAVLRNFRGRE
ncbi:MAG TPA: DUF177 domain-containing protein [Syntrophales bacterium]|mgnify:CR=1 FL=1|nr:DUF177 domain-containing protein [Syntrophales bacterium]HOM08324.1 DUF177 domain-containing protein [Syntrophales bacterium]